MCLHVNVPTAMNANMALLAQPSVACTACISQRPSICRSKVDVCYSIKRFRTIGNAVRARYAVTLSSRRAQRADVIARVAQAPHSGYHYDGTSRSFFEGWYWKVLMPGTGGQCFALIYSIDPVDGSVGSGVGMQVMGPDDGYICQFSRDCNSFWAERNSLALGAAVKLKPEVVNKVQSKPRGMLPKDEFFRLVEQGFQASFTNHQGSIVANEDGATGAPMSRASTCSWSFSIKPVYAWGNASEASQRATAGWLSMFSVFEPHWQILMSHGLASGWFEWDGKRYEFMDAPAYAEKNWGGGFPTRWHWVQCNSFDEQLNLALTAVGARRALLVGMSGLEENVGMIGIHHNGDFIELVPWNGEVDWDVAPWGSWYLHASNSDYEATVEASCDADAGTVLRAPTTNQGLAPFCKDTFFGRCRLRVWRKNGGVRESAPFIDASTTSAALEVGGGPWWANWKETAEMKEPFKSLVKLPIDVAALKRVLPPPVKPPGL